MSNPYRKQGGFGLIEVLIAAVVVAVGLLAVAGLHAKLVSQSGDSKARSEAVALAQARIEDLRNYTNAIEDRADFDAAFAPTGGVFTNATTLDGVNASFERSEAIGNVGETKQVQINVAWNDANGVAQGVTLATELAFESPRAAGDIARSPAAPLVTGPTGRARLGEGVLPPGSPTVANGDGTEIYDDGTGNPKLVVDGRIVLTLIDACQAEDGSCVDFVTIEGTVYIDRATQSNLEPGEVNVLASNASYCHRFYTAADGSVVSITDESTSALLTSPGGSYEYFNYRCYMGGGWYGNVGILLADGLTQSDKICQGDPTSLNAWSDPVISARRTYRGMVYKLTASGIQVDADGDPVVYSNGIADSTDLPDPSYPSWVSGGSYSAGDRVVYNRYTYIAQVDHSGITTAPKLDGSRWWELAGHHGHDFVVARLTPTDTEGSKCVTTGIMTRSDSLSGGLFLGVPTDFVCLNPDHLDTVSQEFVVPITCPYSPVNGPARRHVISGTVVVDDTSGWTDAVSINTSDGDGNCTRTAFTVSGGDAFATYSCDVFEWGSGWNGYVEIKANSRQMICTDGGVDGVLDSKLAMSGVLADTAGKNFVCNVGNIVTISGVVSTQNTNRVVESALISEAGGWCTVAVDGLSYECTTAAFTSSTWDGTITFTPGGGVVCGDNVDRNTGTATFSNLDPGDYTLNLGVVTNTGATCPY